MTSSSEEHWTDGGCTGFPNGVGKYNWTDCCLIHDGGGSDGALLDCIQNSTTGWAEPLIIICIFVMVLFRPIYLWLHKHGLAK